MEGFLEELVVRRELSGRLPASGIGRQARRGEPAPLQLTAVGRRARGARRASRDGCSYTSFPPCRPVSADNYCHYVENYDSLDAAYDWARQTLNDHRNDKREHVYTKQVTILRPRFIAALPTCPPVLC